MDIRKIGMWLMASTLATTAMAQTDLGIWTEGEANFSLSKKWEVSAGGELRTADAMGEIARWSLGVTGEFKPKKFLGIGLGYCMIDDHEGERTTAKGNRVCEYWQLKHRLFGQAKVKMKVEKWNFGLRMRYQMTHQSEVSVAKYGDDGKRKSNEVILAGNENILRSRLAIGLKTETRLAYFATYELFNDMDDGMDLKKQRLEIGTDIKLSKKHSISISYKRNIYSNDSDDKTHNVIGLGYTFNY